MSTSSIASPHIAYELIGASHPHVTVIEFLSKEILVPLHAQQLGEQLASLLRPGMPRRFVLDFRNVRTLGSTTYANIVAFARRVSSQGGEVRVCNIRPMLRLGGDVLGLGEHVQFESSRQAAIEELCSEPEFHFRTTPPAPHWIS
jgi:anti-anti-sigma regulatory factor